MEYLDKLNKFDFNELDNELRLYAKENKVPIIQDEGLHFLRQIIMVKDCKRVLEIGTAIGYSAIQMAKLGVIVDTIEINETMYNLAKENVKKAKLEDKRINVVFQDALDVNLTEDVKYDLIFIDAAKAQYINFFLKFKELLNDKGIILTDNLLFHGLVLEENIESRNLRQLVNKIKKYNEWLLEQEDFDTTIYNIGDGVALSIKK